MRRGAAALACLLAAVAAPPVLGGGDELLVATAANLATAFTEVGRAFEARTGVAVHLSLGATGALARQIEQGAPFDLFAAADTATVDALASRGDLDGASRRVFARGRLAAWAPPATGLRLAALAELRRPEVRRIVIANPATAPYGAAAREALTAAGLWDELAPRVVFADNVAAAKQVAATGNAEVAFVAVALLEPEDGPALPVDGNLHRPLDHAVAVVAASGRRALATRFVEFLGGPEAQAVLVRHGYTVPPARR